MAKHLQVSNHSVWAKTAIGGALVAGALVAAAPAGTASAVAAPKVPALMAIQRDNGPLDRIFRAIKARERREHAPVAAAN